MQKDYWVTRWKENNIGFNQENAHAFLKKFFPTLTKKERQNTFVPLCGKSVDMLWLASQGVKVLGVELSDIACIDFFKENKIHYTLKETSLFSHYKNEQVELLCGDYFNLTSEHLKDISLVYDRAALIALPKDMRRRYATHMINNLPNNTIIFLITTEYVSEDIIGPPFSVSEEEVDSLFGQAFKISKCYEKVLDKVPPVLKSLGVEEGVENFYLLHRDSKE